MVRMLLIKGRCEFGFTHLTPPLTEGGSSHETPIELFSTMSITVLLVCGLVLAGCGAMGGPEEASKPKPELTTVAGDGGGQLGDGGPATEAGLCDPADVAFDAAENMYIADTGVYCSGPGGNTVRKVDPHGTITTMAGTGEAGFSGDGGLATKAKLNSPSQWRWTGRGTSTSRTETTIGFVRWTKTESSPPSLAQARPGIPATEALPPPPNSGNLTK